MPKSLVVCRCDPKWLAIAVCETCEARDAWNAVVKSYFDDDARLDDLDAWRMGRA